MQNTESTAPSMINIESSYFLNRLENNEYFSYSRFNDGELICAIQSIITIDNKKENCDRHMYFPSMGKELASTLNRSDCINYFIQYLDGYYTSSPYNNYSSILLSKNILTGIYQKTDFLQNILRNNPNEFRRFIQILNSKEILLVGPAYLSSISFIKYKNFIEIPLRNCYLEKNNILKMIEKINPINSVLLFSASMSTNVIIDELYEQYGRNNFMLDIGSLFDIFYIDINKQIRQRGPNLNRVDSLKKNYSHYFQK